MADSVKRDQKIACLMDLVDAFRRERRMTRHDAEAATDLSMTTVTRYFKLMAQRGWIRPAGTEQPKEPRRGVKPTVWEWVA